ncbi:hypothetical protein [Nostoc sp. PA-18-2419]|uniref:hypothetical protein n=1 Tax=Nostoc sp. PA-18-2419 TaxID=2575443 RepID=UPI0016787637|nr:hypothetical protein [Nostoc sp. PA-18-2419]
MAACLIRKRDRDRVFRITHNENRDGKKPTAITKSVFNTFFLPLLSADSSSLKLHSDFTQVQIWGQMCLLQPILVAISNGSVVTGNFDNIFLLPLQSA